MTVIQHHFLIIFIGLLLLPLLFLVVPTLLIPPSFCSLPLVGRWPQIVLELSCFVCFCLFLFVCQVLNKPRRPVLAILGGAKATVEKATWRFFTYMRKAAKVSDKIQLIKNMLDKAGQGRQYR